MIDVKAIKEHFDGDEELIGELTEIFDGSYPKSLAALVVAIQEKNFSEIELHAHTLKGMISNFFAVELKNAAANLEKIGRDKVDAEMKADLSYLKDNLPKVSVEVKKVLV